MSNSNHTLNRFSAVNTVNSGLPLTQVEAHDALHAIAHEFSIYEVETAELYAFGNRIRRILAEKGSSRDQLERIAADLDQLDGRINGQVDELASSQRSVIPVNLEPVAMNSGDWPIG